MPLRDLIGPPCTTRVRTSLPSLPSTRSSILPSSIRMVSSAATSEGSDWYEVLIRSLVPSTSSEVMSNC